MSISPGALRFNTDSQKLELYDGNQWTESVASSPDSQTGGARGVFGGGYSPAGSKTDALDYITISTTGNALDFGNLTVSRAYSAACASSTRGVWAGGYRYPETITSDVIDFATISSTGNAQDFGDLSVPRSNLSACSNSTRGVFAGGAGNSNVIDYVTIASKGDSVDFGDISVPRRRVSTCASATRGIFAGGNADPSINVIEFITTSTLGNAADFGDLSNTSSGKGGCSNAIRGVFGGGNASAANTIDFITIATLGNAVSFGSLTRTLSIEPQNSAASSTRGVWAGGYSPDAPTTSNIVDYVTIMSIGNAIDFGDLTAPYARISGCSNGHGGLG